MRQFFVEEDLHEGGDILIEGENWRHLTLSLRARPGEKLRIADMKGRAFDGEVVSIGRRSAAVRLGSEVSSATLEPMTLGICLSAAESMDTALEAAVQLGATKIVPLVSENSRPGSALKAAKWNKKAKESCGQCLRAELPKITLAIPIYEFFKQEENTERFIAIPQAASDGIPLKPGLALSLLVGPEGGFSQGEIEASKEAGWRGLYLGPQILRVGVAVAAGLALLQQARRNKYDQA
jgi:16S rRNA (uracil1498-N3)-methyltransferase